MAAASEVNADLYPEEAINGCECIPSTQEQRAAAADQYTGADFDATAVANYGSACGTAWDDSAGSPWKAYCPDTSDKNTCKASHNWCALEWCYVNMTTCAAAGGDPQPSGVFKTAAGDGTLYYSYETCGSTNCYSETDPDGDAATIFDGPISKFFDGQCPSGPGSDSCTDCDCVGELPATLLATSDKATGAEIPTGYCPSTSAASGTLFKDLPGTPTYGSACGKAWDGQPGTPWKEYCDDGFDCSVDNWCGNEWCYINPKTCTGDDTVLTSTFAPQTAAIPAPTTGVTKMKYSYATCGFANCYGTPAPDADQCPDANCTTHTAQICAATTEAAAEATAAATTEAPVNAATSMGASLFLTVAMLMVSLMN